MLILHHISPAHLACVEAKQNKELYEANDAQHHPWLNVIVKMDKQLLQHMNQVILDVYNDAKIGTLSAWSWPSRFQTQCFAEQINENPAYEGFEPYQPRVKDNM